MTEEHAFCPYPGDLDGCRKALIKAFYRKLILQHCIMEGLRRNFPQCRQVLLEGLRGSGSLAEACKQVVLTGYPQDIKTIPNILYEAYQRLVRTVTLKQGITEVSQPSVDDVCQEVFLALHKYLYRGLNVQKKLSTYISRVTINTLFGLLKSKGQDIVELDEQLIEEKVSARKDPVPITVVEYWEELDRMLAHSPLGNPVNRIILAQQVVEGCSTGTAPSAQPLKQEWAKLSEMSDQEIEQLFARTRAEAKDISANEVVWTVAHMLNTDLAELFQIPILFIAGLKLDADQAGQELEPLFQLGQRADGTIYARINRIKAVLRRREGKPHKEGENHDRR